MRKGIAVSEEQGTIDWSRVKNSGIEYAMVCCGVGGDHVKVDACFYRNAEGCLKNQVPFGAYLYSRATNQQQIKEELAAVLQLLELYEPRYPVMLYLGDCDTTLTLKQSELAEIAGLFCEGVQQAGYKVGIYANKYWFTNLLTDVRFEQWERWIIQHYKECTFSGNYQMWQYTSMGKVEGINGYVKMSESYDAETIPTVKSERGIELPNLQGYVGTSIVGALNKQRYPSDYNSRRRLAAQSGLVSEVSEYKGTGRQNQELIRRFGGTVSTSKMLREGTFIKLKPGSHNIITDKDFEKEVYANTFRVLAISGISVVFGTETTVVGKVNRNSILVV